MIVKFTLFATVCFFTSALLAFAIQPDSTRRVYEKRQFYPNGKLEVSALAFTTKYFGEYTDQYIGYSGGIMTRYMFPFLPEIGFGARLSSGWLEYERRYKARFGDDFLRQFPLSDFPTAKMQGVMRRTWYSAFDPIIFLNLFPRSSVNYYLFGGYSALVYAAQDIDEDPINDGGKRKHYLNYVDMNAAAFHWFGGMGFDVMLSRRLSIGTQWSFRYVQTDLLDGYGQVDGNGKATNPDNFAEAGLKLSYYLFEVTDTDRDGISDEDELKLGTNPYDSDTDGDGISDFDEITLYKSDPLKTDSDGDGMSDYDEVVVYHTDPNASDTDKDDVSDIDEVLVYKTNPRLPDSDGDGLGDHDEIIRGTNPMNADSDADDVPDGQDKCPLVVGAVEYSGCPAPKREDAVTAIAHDTIIVAKTDTIYINNSVAVLPKDVITIKKGQSFTVYGINFGSGSSIIEPTSYSILDSIAEWLHVNGDISTEVRGHTDSIGTAASNMTLSNDRARAVIEYLAGKGISRNRLSAAGFGESRPIGDNGSSEGRAMNRRIEFYVKNN